MSLSQGSPFLKVSLDSIYRLRFLACHEFPVCFPQLAGVLRKVEPGRAGDNSLLSLIFWRFATPSGCMEAEDDAEEKENLDTR